MGIFGIVSDAGGGRLAGYTIEVHVPGGGKIPGGEVTTTSRSDDRNYEMNIYQPGAYQVVVSDGTREVSPRVTVNVEGINSENCEPRGGGSQWVKVNFRKTS